MIAAYVLIHCICGSPVHTVKERTTKNPFYRAKIAFAGIGDIKMIGPFCLFMLTALSVTKIMK